MSSGVSVTLLPITGCPELFIFHTYLEKPASLSEPIAPGLQSSGDNDSHKLRWPLGSPAVPRDSLVSSYSRPLHELLY